MSMSDTQEKFFFTSESVTEGHPDKVADQISDSILDAIMAQDKRCRVACETLVTTGMAFIAGEITTNTYVEMPQIVRDTIRDIGYSSSKMGFDWQTCAVMTSIDHQSLDISMGVDKGDGLYKEQGAGDQGLMFGYATDETTELMPAPISYAHRMAKKLADLRKTKKLGWLRPDGKTQVTIEYEGATPMRASALVVSTQHSPDVKHKTIVEAIRTLLVEKVVPAKLIDKQTKIYVNPTGRFVVGGPFGDAGLTGRKIIVDTYGGMGRHGGGAFSGKDPSKVDRSAAYMARYAAKNVVKAELAQRCEIQLAYAIGVAEPVSIHVETFGTNAVSDHRIIELLREHLSFKPKSIIETLKLKRPIYRQTAKNGHFGHSGDSFPWEQTDLAEKLKKSAGV